MADRRDLLKSTIAGCGLLAGAAAGGPVHAAGKEKPTSANEDLMREHSVLRRALLVYGEAAQRLDRDAGSIPADALRKIARLFRAFGEDYHERRLEEKFIFPAVRKLKGPVARYPDILEQQHERGRALNSYVLQVSNGGKVASSSAAPLAKALREFNLMYEHHAAREDADVFTAWKESLSARAYEEMGEQFEHIEQQVFGHDGFEDALGKIAAITAFSPQCVLAPTALPRARTAVGNTSLI